MSRIRYYCYPRTETPPEFAEEIAAVFRNHEAEIGTEDLDDGLKSDDVLEALRSGLEDIGFEVEQGKKKDEKIHRPVLFGENGEPQLRYEVDGYHPERRYGLEIEAGRAWMGNAIYRDLIQASVMVQVDRLVLAVPNVYRYSGGENPAFDHTRDVVETIYTTERFDLPFDLILLGY
mgnify:CR=1 FL=1